MKKLILTMVLAVAIMLAGVLPLGAHDGHDGRHSEITVTCEGNVATITSGDRWATYYSFMVDNDNVDGDGNRTPGHMLGKYFKRYQSTTIDVSGIPDNDGVTTCQTAWYKVENRNYFGAHRSHSHWIQGPNK